MDLKKIVPGIQLVLIISPVTPLTNIEPKIKDNVFDMLAPLSSISAADLAVTIPGTNNAQIANIGIPLLMLLPLNKLSDIPLEGSLHYISKIPAVGYVLRMVLAEIIMRQKKFFSLPNIKAQKMLVPELKGRLTPEQVVEQILELLNNPGRLTEMSVKLRRVMGESNAAEMIISEILNENLPAPV